MLAIMQMKANTIIAIALLAVPTSCGESSAPSMESAAVDTVAIVGARLIDGTGAEPIVDSTVVIHGDRIQVAGPRESTAVPDGTEVIDGTGKTIIPGLVDMHNHYTVGDLSVVDRRLRTQLYFGVTTARSMGSDPPEKVARMLEAHASLAVGPRMYTAGRGFTHPNGFPPGNTNNQPTTEDEAREMVRDLAGQGVHFVKMWVNKMQEPNLKITPEMRAAIVDEAIKNNLVPVAHIDEEADVRQLINVGVKDFLHTVTDTEVGNEFLQLCLDNGVTFSPTLSIVQAGWLYAAQPELLQDPDIRAAFDPEVLVSWDDPEVRAKILESPNFEGRKEFFKRRLAFVKKISDAGISVAVGTDSGTRNVPMGWATHHEMQLFVEAGLTPMQAIVAATQTGSELMARADRAEFGTLEGGKIADLIVLNADPLTDIRNTLEIDQVMQSGTWVDRSGLLPTP